jgi:hypothetical protein
MAKKKKAAPKQKPVDVYPKVIETFKQVDNYWLDNLRFKDDKTHCFNGIVSIKRYRVTVELIQEPIEVYQERLQKLWDECDNSHHWLSLEMVARDIAYELKGRPGNQRKNNVK